MSAPPGTSLNQGSISATAIGFALLPAITVPLAFAAAVWQPEWIVGTGALAALFLLASLWRAHRLIASSTHAVELSIARWHIWLHAVPVIFLVARAEGFDAAWFRAVLVVLFAGFFYTGRKSWKCFAELFPDKPLYRLFLRGNTAFLTSFPIIYVASLILPSYVSFAIITNVAQIYFAIHLTILGPSTLRIEADLAGASQ